MRILVPIVAAALLLPAPASAQARGGDPRPALWEFITFERIMQGLVQTGVVMLRTQMDITYGHVAADLYTQELALSQVSLAPPVPYGPPGQCRIAIDRVVLGQGPISDWNRSQMRIEATGVAVPAHCLPFELRPPLLALGREVLEADWAMAEIDYSVGSGAAEAVVHVSLPELGVVQAELHFAQLSPREPQYQLDSEPYGQDAGFVALLSGATITYEDHGLIARARDRGLMPPQLREPAAARAAAEDAFAAEMGDLRSPEEHALQAAIGAAVERLWAEGGRVVLNLAPERPFPLQMIEQIGPWDTMAALRPEILAATAARRTLVPAALLEQALADPAALDAADRRRVGLALATGRGAPRSLPLGRALLEPLAEAGDAEVAMSLAEALRAGDPEGAYRLAARAGAQGSGDAAGFLEELEGEIATPRLLQLQAELVGAEDAPEAVLQGLESDDLGPLREHALARLSGQGAVKSYARAYLWATLGAAAGDEGMARLAEQIERRMLFRGALAEAAWAEAAEGARDAAMRLWLDRRLMERLAIE